MDLVNSPLYKQPIKTSTEPLPIASDKSAGQKLCAGVMDKAVIWNLRS